MSYVLDLIAADLAAIRADAPPPASLAPLGYGTDLSCVRDLTEDLVEVNPLSTRAISEAIVRRLITPRGALIDDQDYGFDVRPYCNRAVTADSLRALKGYARAEALKDDRVADANVTLAYASNALTITIMITAHDPALGVFSLVFTVDATGATLAESIDKRG